jgi:hypothetical protein
MKPAPPQYVTSLRLPLPLAYATERGAKQAGMSLSRYIRWALERALEADGIEVAPAAVTDDSTEEVQS